MIDLSDITDIQMLTLAVIILGITLGLHIASHNR